MVYNPFALKGKTVLVTGASSGIGRATAIECSKMGASLIISGRNKDRLMETFEALEGTGHRQIQANLANVEGINGLVDQLESLDGVVHSAGIGKTLPFQFITNDYLNEIMQVNFVAPTILSQTLIKKKKLQKGSSIVFISSIDGPITAHIGNSMYSSSKGAVTAMAKNMAVELAAKSIRVNCILPGMIETPMIYSGGISKEQLEKDRQLYPLKRYGQPEEIAYAIIYFLSDASKWTTGTSMVIDGGFILL